MVNIKYELRSSDAQEIMRKPPRAFIARGNILILSALVVVFYFLNTIPLYKRETINCEIVNRIEIANSSDSGIIMLSIKVKIPDNIKPKQAAKLHMLDIRHGKDSLLIGRIDSIDYNCSQSPMLFFKCGLSASAKQTGRFGNIEIITKKETLFSMISDRFRF